MKQFNYFICYRFFTFCIVTMQFPINIYSLIHLLSVKFCISKVLIQQIQQHCTTNNQSDIMFFFFFFKFYILNHQEELRWKFNYNLFFILLSNIVNVEMFLCVFTVAVPTELRTEPDDKMFISCDCTHVFALPLFGSGLLHRSTHFFTLSFLHFTFLRSQCIRVFERIHRKW